MFFILSVNKTFTRRAHLFLFSKRQPHPIKDVFLANFENLTQRAAVFFIVKLFITTPPIQAFHPNTLKFTSNKQPKTMDPAPQPPNSDAQQAPPPTTAAPTTVPNKPVTVAAPKAAPRAMGRVFTISGILEGDEGTEFSPDENREVTDQQMKNVLDEAAVRTPYFDFLEV
jgi:hypothetical protein